MITEDLTGGRVCYFYDSVLRTKLNLKSALPGNWTPLGSAIKWLMYVDYVQGLDRLISHDVDSQAWHITKSSAQRQVGCGMTGNTCVFGEYRGAPVGSITPVDLYTANVGTGAILLFCSSDSEKSQFAHDGDLLVYTARYPSGSTAIYGHYFQGTGEFLIHQCDASEPSVCGNIVAWAQRSGAGWNIIAKDISSGEVRNIAYTTADPPRPEAGRSTVFWQDARNLSTTGTDIYGYDWQTREEFVVTNATGNQTRLRVCDDLVTWVSGPTNYEVLWAARIPPGAPDTQDGDYIDFDGTVTGISPDMGFYVKQSLGMLAVRVVPSAQQPRVAIGDAITATGVLALDNVYHGPVIRQAIVTIHSSGNSIQSLAMTNKSLGGSIADLPGAPNVWLPVKVWGRASSLALSNGCSFTITDGSVTSGVRVISPFPPPEGLANGCWVCVSGICRVSRIDGREVEVVDQGGIQVN